MVQEAFRNSYSAGVPDLIMPVPLHRKKLASRGFNQAVLLGEIVSRGSEDPSGTSQPAADPLDRAAGQSGRRRSTGKCQRGFRVHDPSLVNGRRVLLVDDVLTTGSTAEECSRVLKRAGAADVTVVTVARAVTKEAAVFPSGQQSVA